jgi:gas vesicle protein
LPVAFYGFGSSQKTRRYHVKERYQMNKDGLANFFLGLGIGVGVGLLFAPKAGEETRGMLMSKANEGTEYLKNQASNLADNASGVASDLVDKGRDVINRQKDNLNEALEAGKQAYRDKVESPNGVGQNA